MWSRTVAVIARRIAGGMYHVWSRTMAVYLRWIAGGMYQYVEQNSCSVLTVDSWRYVPMCGAEVWQCSHE